MTASEFAFLSLGLVLGVLSGAAIIEVVRSRPPAPREIRVTVTPDSIPRRRPSTLAEDAFILAPSGPAPGGPGDRRRAERSLPGPPAYRTTVRSPLPPAGAGDPASGLPLSRIVATRPSLGFREPHGSAPGARQERLTAPATPVAVPIHLEPDPQMAALRGMTGLDPQAVSGPPGGATEASPGRAGTRSGAGVAVAPLSAVAPVTAGAVAPVTAGAAATVIPERLGDPSPVEGRRPVASAMGGVGDGEHATVREGGESAGQADCTEVRRIADERCALATRAREQSDAALGAVREAQRRYDEHMARATRAGEVADPRTVRAAKEQAQVAFRETRAEAADPHAVESAAREWLGEINRINREAREAAAVRVGERDAAQALLATIERLTVEADAARLAADTAEAGCVAAREAVAGCEGAGADRSAPTAWPELPSLGSGVTPVRTDDETELEAAFSSTGAGEPAILRLLRGDRATLTRIVAELAGEDPAERRRWQLALAGLVDAIVGRAIEAAYLSFPTRHAFWGLFTAEQGRDIASALSSLGYRFDGLGGWADDRIPSPRDMSLAVGYAGLDPMRTRHWPREHEMAALMAEVRVAADEYLADVAGGLTLGELVTVLGRRADALADLWNDWARVRPLLLSGD